MSSWIGFIAQPRNPFAALVLVLALAPGGAIAQLSSAPLLGDAPVGFESQDTSGWKSMPAGPQPGAARQHALEPYGSSAAASTRDQVAQFYNSVYVPGNAVPLFWSGSIASCTAGAINPDLRQAVLDRVNYFRALAGLPAVGFLGEPALTQSQSAALMMSANSALSHTPPASWACYSGEGFEGASHSNLALGAAGVTAVDLYLDDAGSNNAAVGHRRWVLFPPQVAMDTGDVPGGAGRPAANALYVFGTRGARPATPNGVAWPPAGFVPYPNLPRLSNRWSLSYPGADFRNASVSVVGPQGSLPVQFESIANGYGDNTLVFLPFGVSYGAPSYDTSYTVTVSGIAGSGVPSTIQYVVTVIDPAVPSWATPSTYSRQYVQKAYVAYYGRPADPAGLDYWAARMDASGGSLEAIIGAFGTSAEFFARYGGLDEAALVTSVYRQALARDPDPAGLAWYVNELEDGRRTIQTITLDVLNGATGPVDTSTVMNKLDVAGYYTFKVQNGCPYGPAEQGTQLLAAVTADPVTVGVAKASIDSICASR